MDKTPTKQGRSLRTRKPVDYSDSLARFRELKETSVRKSERKIKTEKKCETNDEMRIKTHGRLSRSVVKKLTFDKDQSCMDTKDVKCKMAKLIVKLKKEPMKTPDVNSQCDPQAINVPCKSETKENDVSLNSSGGDGKEGGSKKHEDKKTARGRSIQVNKSRVLINNDQPNGVRINDPQARRSARRSVHRHVDAANSRLNLTDSEEEQQSDAESDASDEFQYDRHVNESTSDSDVQDADSESDDQEPDEDASHRSDGPRKTVKRMTGKGKSASRSVAKKNALAVAPRSSVKRKLYFPSNPMHDFDDTEVVGSQLLRGDCTAASINITQFDTSDESAPEASDNDELDENGAYRLNYFVASASTAKTSNNSLKDLDLSVLGGNFFKSLTEEQEQMVTDRHEHKLFPKLYLLMRERFNIIVYGLGSKKELLDHFCQHWLADEHHLSIYGFFGELTIRHVLSSLAEPLASVDISEDALLEAASQLDHELYIVVHSIDLLFSNEPKLKRFFCQLLCTSTGRIHLIGSTDHVHSSMLFNNSENQACNWIWLDATTFHNYQLERGYQASCLKNTRGNLQSGIEWQHLTMSSLLHVYNSLTPNAKQIFELILNEWLENCPEPEDKRVQNRAEEMDFEGIRFSDLLKLCLENFFVNSELTLRTQLTEFKDHKLIRVLKTAGVEKIQVMVERKTIQKFLDKISQ